ncbi:MAG: hypothetical protein KatS3mg033_0141 [Thermonema sp.]|nr:MAG: hypothetical protein KatS3mg033_0141 [Thermonema sp.]
MTMKRKIISGIWGLLCLMVLCPAFSRQMAEPAAARDSAFWIVRRVVFEGNKKTKDEILRRELALLPGDTLPVAHWQELLTRERNKLFNTDLFVTVEAWIEPDSAAPAQAVDIHYRFKERWYIFPVFIFELADRNFNEWLYDRKADFSRTNYGMRYVQKNLRGRNERLELLFQQGFTRKYEFYYVFPYIDRHKRYGMELRTQLMQNRDIPYTSQENKLVYWRSTSTNRERWNSEVRLRRREGFYLFHYLTVRYKREWVADSVLLLNPDYFTDSTKNLQQYWELQYDLVKDRRDIAVYPLQGERWGVRLTKHGIGNFSDVDAFSVKGIYERYWQLKGNWFADLSGSVRFFWTKDQPYSLARGLGYGEELPRGFQRYVMDGQHFFLLKSTLKYRFFDWKTYLRFMPLEEFRTFPLALYGRLFFDQSYVSDKLLFYIDNRLANRWLYAYGAGFDFVTFYNVVLQAEIARNNLGETGFFFNIRGTF